MDDALIVAIYVMIDDTMKTLGHRSHCLSSLSDAEVLTIAVLAARYYGNHHGGRPTRRQRLLPACDLARALQPASARAGRLAGVVPRHAG